MLKFYYNPISVNARRVWVALLEKQIPFEPLLLNLDGDQFQEEFTAINPLQRVPVIVDNGLRVVESLAILDYLETKYPNPSLIPSEPGAIATVRMVEMITVSELQPATVILTRPLVELDTDAKKLASAQEAVAKILQFYETLLGEQIYFAGKDFTLAEVVAGTLIPSLPLFGFSLDDYPRLLAWAERLEERESWQKTTPDFASIAAAIPNIKAILERRF
ncbi:Glutathione S-transferase-like protein [Trichormus variabilis ATCC 29413]|uniref:Glutathione S-transferase-like protein n=2 Tax=Anabaena variabilis TaxID=264691 RepID=Q3MGG9_TRIV2|nr:MULTISPECIES: glutathione S-transferase family protein [Nostocaceae]ABA19917.1 Glutathione S-transferase-like protein [Trichormus variabilis ATCC 29413]MBC1215877.1 glutathione S-transferase family protein [Trichormus variabilis ARAD]MBC1255727.1 glutathione S-transferase family protein [Trichormus variabilis V5]MBC1266286.1 glutathione S-transferase family protein [Trichormus variabilis FSR]MBC1304512.1 glutathione S-transferase family protein [Trichormus variabilis N2B]